LFLRSVWSKAQAESIPLCDALLAAALQREDEIRLGKVLTLSSGSGKQVQFAIPQGGHEPIHIIEAWEYLLSLYETVKPQLTDQSDAAVYAEMLEQLQPVTKVENDFRLSRWPYLTGRIS
jgi:hypothetical protein